MIYWYLKCLINSQNACHTSTPSRTNKCMYLYWPQFEIVKYTIQQKITGQTKKEYFEITISKDLIVILHQPKTTISNRRGSRGKPLNLSAGKLLKIQKFIFVSICHNPKGDYWHNNGPKNKITGFHSKTIFLMPRPAAA